MKNCGQVDLVRYYLHALQAHNGNRCPLLIVKLGNFPNKPKIFFTFIP